MKFLQQEFEESIIATVDKAGIVFIGETPFAPTVILQTDPEAYDEEFNRWKSEEWFPKKQEKLNEILRYGSNQDRFDNLLERIESERVVPFVGSGMSKPSGMPMWREFLERVQLDSKMTAQNLKELLDTGDYETAASALKAALPQRLFDEKLQNTFRARSFDQISGPIKVLPYLFGFTVITTNYDNIIEIIFAECDRSFSSIFFGKRIEDHVEFREKNERYLLKLHGDYLRPPTRVLFKEEYEECYRDESPFKAELSFIYQRYSLLFLGCSLYNDRTVSLLHEVANRDQNMPKHYAFLSLPDNEAKRIEREHFLTERGIFPIWYVAENNNHDEPIEALLVGLLERLGRL